MRFRSPSEAHRNTPAPSRLVRRPARRTMLPLLGFLALRHIRGGGPVSIELPARPRATSGVSDPHRGVHLRPFRRPKASERPWASPFKASIRASSGRPLGRLCPLVVHRVESPHPQGMRRTRSTSGPCSRRAAVRRRAPCGTRRAAAFLGFLPPERSPSSSWPPLRFAAPPSTRIRRRDVPFRLRLEVFRSEEVGSSLSGPPALLGFSTFRPSRRREDGLGTRAHGLAFPFARVAGGANESVHPRRPSDRGFRLGPTPPSFGGRLSASSEIGRAHV